MSYEDMHLKKACEIFGVKPEQVTPKMRSIAKTINFPFNYGAFTGGGLGHEKSIDELIEEELLDQTS